MTEHLTALFDALSPLWEMSFTAAWVAGVVFLLRLFLKKRAPKRVLCLLWLVVFARLLVPVKLESPVSLVPPALSDSASVGADIIRPHDTEHGGNSRAHNMSPYMQPGDAPAGPGVPAGPSDTGNNSLPVVTAPAPAEDTPASVTPEASGFPWKALLAGIWLAGVATMLGCGLATYLRLRRRVRFAVRVSGRVWEDETVSSPFILGLFNPRIYLPSGLEGRARRFILCHEFAHLRRFDHVVKPLCWLALALHWFNPAVWLAFLLMSRDMEGACDEAVLRSLGEDVKADYSYTLLALASGKQIPAPCPLAFDEGDAKGRIKNVLNYHRPALWIVVVSVIAVVVAAVCLLTNPVSDVGPDDPIGPTDDPPAPTEIEPGPSPSLEPSQTPDEALNSVLDPWMLAVLKGERTFSVNGMDRDIDHLKEAYRSYWRVELGKLAIIDLDRDGAKELVIFPVGDDEYLYSVVGYLILHLEGDTVRGYTPGWRSIGNLKADGTFSWSGGASFNAIGLAHFDGGEFSPELFTYVENGSCTVEGRAATQKEFDAAIKAQDAKPEPFWYTFEDGELRARISIPLSSYAQSTAVPDFLDADQQLLYRQAYTLYTSLFGPITAAIDTWPGPWPAPVDSPLSHEVQVDGEFYYPATGLFARWDDLETAVLSVFTREFWDRHNDRQHNDGSHYSIYTNVDGQTYYIAASRGNHGTNPNFPDTFHLPTRTETEISFILTGHYSENYPLEGESFEERDARLADHWETYCGFPMKLVLTENGWRFDEFYCANTDEGNAAYSAPNPALTGDPTPEAGACVHGLDHVYVDHLTDGRLVYRCQEDFFPYYPPYPCAYSSESTGEGDYDGDGHMEEIVVGSAGTLMLCDVVDGELRTCTFDPHTLTDAYPDADISTAWIEPGDELIYCVPLRPAPNAAATGTAEFHLHYDGTAITAGPMIQSTQ